MNPVPAWLALSIARQRRISASSVLVIACIVSAIGQIIPSPQCGPPIPHPARPRKKNGLSSLSTKARVARYRGSSTDRQPR